MSDSQNIAVVVFKAVVKIWWFWIGVVVDVSGLIGYFSPELAKYLNWPAIERAVPGWVWALFIVVGTAIIVFQVAKEAYRAAKQESVAPSPHSDTTIEQSPDARVNSPGDKTEVVDSPNARVNSPGDTLNLFGAPGEQQTPKQPYHGSVHLRVIIVEQKAVSIVIRPNNDVECYCTLDDIYYNDKLDPSLYSAIAGQDNRVSWSQGKGDDEGVRDIRGGINASLNLATVTGRGLEFNMQSGDRRTPYGHGFGSYHVNLSLHGPTKEVISSLPVAFRCYECPGDASGDGIAKVKLQSEGLVSGNRYICVELIPKEGTQHEVQI